MIDFACSANSPVQVGPQNANGVIIFVVDLKNQMIAGVNEAVSILGYQPDDLINKSYSCSNDNLNQKLHQLIKATLQASAPTCSQQVLLPKNLNTENIPFEFSACPFRCESFDYVLLSFKDIRERISHLENLEVGGAQPADPEAAEREKILKELEQSLAKERELNELRAKFVSTASHQFRTPLTVIQSGVEIMDLYVEDLPEEKQAKFRKQFKKIQEEVDRLEHLMNDVLLLGRANAARTPYLPERKSLTELCRNIIENKYNNRYSLERQVLFTVKGTEVPVSFDPKLLGHALENIINNAYKYSEHGNILLSLIYKVAVVEISISDQGIGIPEADIKNLFQPFYRATNTADIAGTGLGLSIVKEFIEKHKGEIILASKLNKGTTASVILPIE